ncbi:VOC family protein [Aliarcobacter cryaerophilus]|uniref:VOC family protein n=1 Tax=Aliarcobacter cryaerophilus TaxID=28198 RepID=UPI0021B666AC|nr:VOC family protein [Aliarcobacter cryaerophilus]MCT7481177.1 VOC family protein [Aliarcobacter cryaerophilus]
MINILNLDHLVLTVKDIEETVKFYEKLGMKKEIFGKNRVALKYSNQKINLHKLGSEFEPKAKNVKEGSADLCFILEQNLEEIVLYLQKEGIKIEEGIVERTGANGKIKSIYLRDPDLNLGPFRILCQLGKIENTKGHKYENRNRCRAIC